MLEPFLPFLNRDLPQTVKPYVEGIVSLMERCVNYGTHLLMRCDQAGAASGKDVMPGIMLGLHCIEYLDAISVLLSKGCVDPAKVQLRSLLEALLGLSYIAQGDIELRCRQYLVGHAHARIEMYERADPTTDAGKKLAAEIAKDKTLGGVDYVSLNTESNIENLKRLLARPEIAPIEAEWQRVSKKNRYPVWYNLFNGPKTVRELADVLGDQGSYEFMYRMYSGETHAGNALESLLPSKTGSAGAYQPLRYAAELPAIAHLAVSWGLRVIRTLTEMYVPTEQQQYNDWYTEQIREDYMRLLEIKFEDKDNPKRAPKPR